MTGAFARTTLHFTARDKPATFVASTTTQQRRYEMENAVIHAPHIVRFVGPHLN
jgi:hypothetical protein